MISNFIALFAAEDGPHISLKAEEVFELAGFSVTNSMIYGVIIALTTLLVGVAAARKAGIKPMAGITQFFELFMEFMFSMLEQVFGNRQKAVKYAPIFGVFFIFIVFSNVMGLLPIVGEGVTVGETPVFRPFTADLNGTIAMSVIAIIFVQYFSIKESGFLGHLKHYFTDKPLNPINFFIGLLEVFGELTRVLSLSLRLFLNTAVGEILIAVFAFVGASG
ncbi:MAG: F0F1 ATP synthase subunit A, partial [Candidatus Saccharimonadales bacterium]|nr:F0F1 ATP synthase subunit A [Candidatus Saccharimonadales bacterium]